MVHSLSTREERSWMSKEMLMARTKTFKYGTSMVNSTNNGMLSILMNGRENQAKENSMKTSDSMSKDHSTLFHRWLLTDTLT